MPGLRLNVSIRDHKLVFDLRDLLTAMGELALKSSWELADIQATAEGLPDRNPLEELAKSQRTVTGPELWRAARQTAQVIDGWFAGYRHGAADPWVVLFSDDSTYWFVFSKDAALLKTMATQFAANSPTPADDLEDWTQYPLVGRCLRLQ